MLILGVQLPTWNLETISRSRAILLTLVGQRMEIRLMRLDGDDSRGQYIEVYLSVSLDDKNERIRKKKSFPDD